MLCTKTTCPCLWTHSGRFTNDVWFKLILCCLQRTDNYFSSFEKLIINNVLLISSNTKHRLLSKAIRCWCWSWWSARINPWFSLFGVLETSSPVTIRYRKLFHWRIFCRNSLMTFRFHICHSVKSCSTHFLSFWVLSTCCPSPANTELNRECSCTFFCSGFFCGVAGDKSQYRLRRCFCSVYTWQNLRLLEKQTSSYLWTSSWRIHLAVPTRTWPCTIMKRNREFTRILEFPSFMSPSRERFACAANLLTCEWI